MAKQTLAQKTAKQREAGRAVAKINNDVLAVAERNREIVELPPIAVRLTTMYWLERCGAVERTLLMSL
jgi:hypothetical protein